MRHERSIATWIPMALLGALAAAASLGAQEQEPAQEAASPVEHQTDSNPDDSWTGYDQLGQPTTLEQATCGALLFATDERGVYRSAPTLDQDVSIEVFGLIARTTVEQRFFNPTESWVEAVYVFPLPERSAVDELRMRVGEREIVGEIQERGQAKKTYEAAKSAGRKTSLVEQERPNIFTNSVANIGPGEEITIVIEYQEDLRYDNGRISLRFPMVVAPRFIPGTRRVAGFSGTGWGRNTDQVPDAERITPKVVLTASDLAGTQSSLNDAIRGGTQGTFGFADLEDTQRTFEPGPNPVLLTVTIDRNLELDGIESPSHDILVSEARHAYIAELASGPVAANRDFVLEWWPEQSAAPQAALYTHDFEGHTYAHLLVVPPQGTSTTPLERTARELVLIIDTSGSMGGTSIQQARQALLLALDRLLPHDVFDVIEFNSRARSLFDRPVPANADNVDRARRFVRRLDADGGTNILRALELALSDPLTKGFAISTEDLQSNTRTRQIVFITDGSVGNEDAVFGVIERDLGDRRLFTVGIGSAPNGHFMRRAAQFGRGTFTTISDLQEVERRMRDLFAKIESPALVGITAGWDGWSADQIEEIDASPSPLPDLYAGEPVVLNARLPLLEHGAGELVLRGLRGTEAWVTRLAIERGAEREGVDRLWARQKIRSLMDEKVRGVAEQVVRPQVVALGLTHHLVTKYTSLVAVDPMPTRPAGESITSKPIPARLPAGWEAEKVFGPLPQGGTSSRLLIVLGLLSLAAGGVLLRRAS